jgi:hypothetical protein
MRVPVILISGVTLSYLIKTGSTIGHTDEVSHYVSIRVRRSRCQVAMCRYPDLLHGRAAVFGAMPCAGWWRVDHFVSSDGLAALYLSTIARMAASARCAATP